MATNVKRASGSRIVALGHQWYRSDSAGLRRGRFRCIMMFDCIFNYPLLMCPDPKPGIPAGPVPSPCVSLCQIDAASQLCQGCLRTLDEIVAWGNADDAFKLAVWAEIRKREQLIDFD